MPRADAAILSWGKFRKTFKGQCPCCGAFFGCSTSYYDHIREHDRRRCHFHDRLFAILSRVADGATGAEAIEDVTREESDGPADVHCNEEGENDMDVGSMVDDDPIGRSHKAQPC